MYHVVRLLLAMSCLIFVLRCLVCTDIWDYTVNGLSRVIAMRERHTVTVCMLMLMCRTVYVVLLLLQLWLQASRT
jgi:hypothetical protein